MLVMTVIVVVAGFSLVRDYYSPLRWARLAKYESVTVVHDALRSGDKTGEQLLRERMEGAPEDTDLRPIKEEVERKTGQILSRSYPGTMTLQLPEPYEKWLKRQ